MSWSKRERLLFWIAASAAALVAVATTSCTLPATLHVVDKHGRPASDAFVRYYYYGELLNPVHPVTYIGRRMAIGRADDQGRLSIGARVHFRWPLPPSTPPRLLIDRIYVPSQHNALGPIAEDAIDQSGVVQISEDGARVTVFDVSRDPDKWQFSLGLLFDMIRGTLEPHSRAAARPDDAATIAHARELIAHLRREYAALLATHGGTPRHRPERPRYGVTAEERRAWQEQADAALAREPLWGPYLERTWRSNLRVLDRMEAQE